MHVSPVNQNPHALQMPQMPQMQQMHLMAQMVAQMMAGQPPAGPEITLLGDRIPLNPQGHPWRSLGNLGNGAQRCVHPANVREPLAAGDSQTSAGSGEMVAAGAPSSVIDDIATVAARMAKRKDRKDDDESHVSASDTEMAGQAAKKAAKKTNKKKDAPAKASPRKIKGRDDWPSKPKFTQENSRQQVMCRTGRGGQGSSHRILWKDHGGKAGAIAKAEKWLRDKTKEYNSHMKK